jgi:hypothetical protein
MVDWRDVKAPEMPTRRSSQKPEKEVPMTKETNTITAPFLKELDPEFQRFLRLVDRLESEMVRLQVAMADLKIGYYTLTSDIKKTVSKL